MTVRKLVATALTAEAFAPFGDVIETVPADSDSMNAERFGRHDSRARPAALSGRIGIGVVRSREAVSIPYEFDEVECHPLASQAFIPKGRFSFVVVVARAGQTVTAGDLHAFEARGGQGIQYHPGTWHMPLIALETGQEFIVIDRVGGDGNLEMRTLDRRVRLLLPNAE